MMSLLFIYKKIEEVIFKSFWQNGSECFFHSQKTATELQLRCVSHKMKESLSACAWSIISRLMTSRMST